MRIAEHVDVLAPPSLVWAQVSEPSRVLDFFAGMTRWECEGEPHTGLGARYRMLMRVASAEVGGLIEAVEPADGWPALGVQWHPEKMHEPEQRALFERLVDDARAYA